MQISELIAILHHELVKSHNFIAETKGAENASVLHIGIDRVEFELPVTLTTQEATFDPEKVKGMPNAFKKLTVPFVPQNMRLPSKTVKGKTLFVDVINHVDKTDDRVSADSIGRIKIIFKPVIS